MANLAIIPARGGSKRIPRKNIKEFLGKPIIAYSIEVALKSELFDEVMVSTDDDEIASIAKKYGASIPFMRNADTANDFATTMEVLNEVIQEYSNRGQVYDNICCIYPTAPLIQPDDLRNGFTKLEAGEYDSVFPIVSFGYPVWRGFELVEDKAKFIWPEYINSRSQDLKLVYHDAGQWYWFVPSKITTTIFTDNASSIILSEERVQDIDTSSDWCLAEIKYKLLYAQ